MSFSKTNEEKLRLFIEAHKYRKDPVHDRKVAIFDADGTLWHDDIGEGFLKYEIENGLLPVHSGKKHKFEEYSKEADSGDTIKAYSWCATWNQGVDLITLRKWIQNFVSEKFQNQAFPEMKNIIERMKSAGFEVWIVSASPRWVVEEGAKVFGIAPEHIIGLNVKIENGKITDQLEHALPYKAGKVELIGKFIKQQPLFVAGNSMGDINMLDHASELALIIKAQKSTEPNFKSEEKLKAEVIKRQSLEATKKELKKKDWLLQEF